ncbi:MAG: PTS sugar transporter subunit IIB [Clostridiaceae bacterium]
MLKVIAACGNGVSSSQIIKIKIEKTFKDLGIEAIVKHTSVKEAISQTSSYDFVFCSETFKDTFENAVKNGTIIIPIKNLLSDQEIEEKIKMYILKNK